MRRVLVKENGDNADNTINIFNDNFTDGERSTSIMAFIEDDGGRFMVKYYATVHQLSISKEAYQFFGRMERCILNSHKVKVAIK